MHVPDEMLSVDVARADIPGDGAMRRRVVFSGEHLMVALLELDPGTHWPTTRHPEEEVVYVVRGRLEYEDGRMISGGMVTVNRGMQEHPGRAMGDVTTLLLEIYAPPVPALRPSIPDAQTRA